MTIVSLRRQKTCTSEAALIAGARRSNPQLKRLPESAGGCSPEPGHSRRRAVRHSWGRGRGPDLTTDETEDVPAHRRAPAPQEREERSDPKGEHKACTNGTARVRHWPCSRAVRAPESSKNIQDQATAV